MKKLLILLILSLLIFSCKKNEDPTSPNNNADGTGTVSGQVFAANGIDKVPSALVEVQNMTNSPKTYTDIDGKFKLSGVPVGQKTIQVTKGLFKATINVTVVEKQETTTPATKLQSSGKLAYFKGEFDEIEEIIKDLGYPIDEVDDQIFDNLTKMKEYKALFFNCGAELDFFVNQNRISNLQKYIEEGGTAYFSDWAFEYISYVYPDKFEFIKFGIEQHIKAKIVNQELKSFVGKEEVEIEYDLGSWAVVTKIPNDASVYVKGNVETYAEVLKDSPLAFLYTVGKGRFIYTTFHNEANITTDALKILTGFLYSL